MWKKPQDVLAQHIVTVAIGGGFRFEAMLEAIRSTVAYESITDQELQWVLDFVVPGNRIARMQAALEKLIESVTASADSTEEGCSVHQSIAVLIAGRSFELFAPKGLYWPDQRMQFVADTHLIKEATFRTNVIPVPIGSTDGTLMTISKMLPQTEATGLRVLDDLFYSRSSLSPHVRRSVESFLAQWHDVDLMLVRGNHDA